MRIKQEQFDKLDQLDRIEFRQVKNLIDEKYSGGVFISLFNLTLMLFIYISSFSFLVILINPNYTPEMHNLNYKMFYIWLTLPLGMVCDLISSRLNKKATEELENKYFKMENVKRK